MRQAKKIASAALVAGSWTGDLLRQPKPQVQADLALVLTPPKQLGSLFDVRVPGCTRRPVMGANKQTVLHCC